jgi:hypothetical protein
VPSCGPVRANGGTAPPLTWSGVVACHLVGSRGDDKSDDMLAASPPGVTTLRGKILRAESENALTRLPQRIRNARLLLPGASQTARLCN